jgi:hypothetical protein
MSCCGQKRATMTSYTPEPSRRSAPASPAQTLLRYAREGGIVLRGPYSGQIYRFSHDAATPVLAEDVGALLRTGALEHVKR